MIDAMHLYINLRRSRDCRWMFVDMFVHLFVGGFAVALHLLILGSCYPVHINAPVFCPGFQKGRVPSENGTINAVNRTKRALLTQ